MLKRLLSSALRSSWRQRAIGSQDEQVAAYVTRAMAAQGSGDIHVARTVLCEAVALHPAAAPLHALLAEILRTEGRDVEARHSYERALEIAPQARQVRMNYAALLQRLAEPAVAQRVYAQIIDEHPDWAPAYLSAGLLAFEQAEWDKAFSCLKHAIVLVPESAQAHVLFAIAALQLGHTSRAIESCDAALRINPQNTLAARTLAAVYCRLGDTSKLKAALHAGMTPATEDATAIAMALALPSILHSREDIARVRAQLSDALEHLMQSKPRVRDPASEVAATAFYLAYHGEDDRALQERIAALHLEACPELAYVATHCRTPRSRAGGRIRVGMVSNFLYEHSIGRVVRELSARLDRERFSVHLYTSQLVFDATSRALQEAADEWKVLPRDLAAAREQLAREQLDVLLYPEIGMDPLTYFLAFARLAPVQCTTWGHPVTTGIPAMDYFISTDYFEPQHADQHYSERLVRLLDVTFPGYYQRPAMPPLGTEASLGFDRGRRVYFCPHALFKFHPDLDPLFVDILRRDPGGEIVIVHDEERDAYRLARLQARLRHTAGEVYERMVFLPQTQSREGYLQRLQACEVVLDTLHYGGGNTSLEAISAGALVVTLPSQFNRGRHTYGFFRKMRFTGTIASTPDDYVDLAVRIATQRDFRMHLKTEQAGCTDALYADQSAIDQIGAFFEQAVEK